MAIPLRRYWNLLAVYLRPQRARVLLLAWALLSSIGLQLVNPQIVGLFIDRVIATRPLRELTWIALAFLGVAIAGQALALATTYLGENVAWTATNALRYDLALHVLRLDMGFHKTHTPGELIERIDGDVSALANFFSNMALRLLGSGLLALGIMALLAAIDWRIGLVGASYALLTVVVLRATQRPITHAWQESRQAEAEQLGLFGERLAGTEDVRANGAEPYVMRRFFQSMRAVYQKWVRARTVQGISFNLGAVVSLLVQVAGLAFGVALLVRNEITLGAVYLVVHYIGQLREPVDQIHRQVNDLQRTAASINRVQELLHTPRRVIQNAQHSLPAGPLPLTFEEVSFRYDDGTEHALEGISFQLAAGRTLGLLGRTGSGKTTLTRLLFRLYAPTSGTIRLNGTDLGDVALGDLRRRIGLVTQDVQLFRASIRNNLTLFNPRIDDDRLLAAFKTLGLWDWYSGLPNGLDTELQSGDKGLSAGEAQLLALTRVLLKDPGLVILDEASSRLDPATEQLLEQAISRLLANRTAVIVAHRLATVQRADEIMILEGGCIVEHGARPQLAADPGSRFARLLQAGMEEVLG